MRDVIVLATTSRAILLHEYGLTEMPGEAGLLGTGRAMQRSEARLDGRYRRLPECGRYLHWLYHAGLPRQIHAVYG